MAGERFLYSAGDKLPESTGEMVQFSWGNLLDCAREMDPLGVPCIPPGNNLILRLAGMLAEEYLYTLLGNIKIF